MRGQKSLIIADELSQLESEKGYLTPEMVIQAATPESSPLHYLFEWDDAEAAHEHRLVQARHVIRSVRVQLIEDRKTNKYWNAKVTIEGKNQQAYFNTARVLQDDKLFDSVLGIALTEIKNWQTKYEHLKELKNLVDNDKLKEIEKLVK